MNQLNLSRYCQQRDNWPIKCLQMTFLIFDYWHILESFFFPCSLAISVVFDALHHVCCLNDNVCWCNHHFSCEKMPTMWGPQTWCERWFRFAPVTTSLFAYHKPVRDIGVINQLRYQTGASHCSYWKLPFIDIYSGITHWKCLFHHFSCEQMPIFGCEAQLFEAFAFARFAGCREFATWAMWRQMKTPKEHGSHLTVTVIWVNIGL